MAALPLGEEEPPSNLLQRDGVPTAAAISCFLAFLFCLVAKVLGSHCEGQRIANLSRFLLHVRELRSPGRITLWAIQFSPQLFHPCLHPFLQLRTQCHPWHRSLPGLRRLGRRPSKFSPFDCQSLHDQESGTCAPHPRRGSGGWPLTREMDCRKLRLPKHLPEWRNGRRAGLKIQLPQGSEGSTPSSGT